MRNNSSNRLTSSHELALFLLDDQFPNWRVADVRTEVVGNPDQKLSKFMTVDFELKSRDALHCPCCGCKAEYYDSMPRRIWDSQPLGSTKTTIGASIPRKGNQKIEQIFRGLRDHRRSLEGQRF